MYGEREGAFTGEISPLMLKELGCSYVICGHSERRMIFGESNEMIRRKTEAAFWYDMIPILCVGETAEQRKAGQAEMMIARQLKGALQGLIEEEAGRMVIAYEPVWAIGSGEAASPEEAGQICTRIRAEVAQMLGHDAASSMRILYGGSVSPANIRPLMDQPDIDGALVGGASLEAGRLFRYLPSGHNKRRKKWHPLLIFMHVKYLIPGATPHSKLTWLWTTAYFQERRFLPVLLQASLKP